MLEIGDGRWEMSRTPVTMVSGYLDNQFPARTVRLFGSYIQGKTSCTNTEGFCIRTPRNRDMKEWNALPAA